MSLTTKNHLSMVLQTIKKLLSLELKSKIDKSEIKEIDAIEIATEIGLITPIVAEDGSIYTDKNNNIYSL